VGWVHEGGGGGETRESSSTVTKGGIYEDGGEKETEHQGRRAVYREVLIFLATLSLLTSTLQSWRWCWREKAVLVAEIAPSCSVIAECAPSFTRT
jgi:hypothetical protein